MTLKCGDCRYHEIKQYDRVYTWTDEYYCTVIHRFILTD